MLMWFARPLFVLIGGSLGYQAARLLEWNVFSGAVTGVAATLVLVAIELAAAKKRTSNVWAVALGLFVGFIAARLVFEAVILVGGPELHLVFGEKVQETQKTDALTGRTLRSQERVPVITREGLENLIKIALIGIFCYMGVAIMYRSKDDLESMVKHFKGENRVRPFVLDTNIIMDGRIVGLCEMGMIDAPLLVPRFVLQELKSIADLAERPKRDRALRGLDTLQRLQIIENVKVEIHDAVVPDAADVDNRLVGLAKKLDGRIITNDTNLSKIAKLEGVSVINVRELAHALRPPVARGEEFTLLLEKPGEAADQAVGFREDGTMVVVDHARPLIGQQATVVVTNVLENPTGRIVFSKLKGQA